MAFTARLNPEVEQEAKRYAGSLGISLNALLSVALRDYLDARQAMPASGGPLRSVPALPAVAPVLPLDLALRPAQDGPVYRAPKSKSDPCPCGAKGPTGFRLKWKQCHGRASQ